LFGFEAPFERIRVRAARRARRTPPRPPIRRAPISPPAAPAPTTMKRMVGAGP